MAVKLNSAGASHASSLISSGDYDDTSAWSFSAEDGDKLLGPKGDDWTAYSQMHLGEDTSATDKTKARWKYPFGKNGKVYGAALRAIRSRASQQGATAIFDEAGKLLDEIKAKEGGGASDRKIVPFRAATKPDGRFKFIRNAVSDGAEIYLYGPIGMSWFGDGVSANQFRQDLTALGPVKTIDLHINSEGGDVFDGQAIYQLLKNHTATVTAHIDGLAASAASFVAMAADSIEIGESSFMMIHNASGACFGGADDMRKTATLLDSVCAALCKVYSDRTNTPTADVKTMMDAETWMDGAQAVAAGFADVCKPNMAVAACVSDPTRYRHLPKSLHPNQMRAALALRRIASAVAAGFAPTLAGATKFKIGDRVEVKDGMEHGPDTGDVIGTVKEISTPALGILFDGMPEIHHWYVDDEIELASDDTAARADAALRRIAALSSRR